MPRQPTSPRSRRAATSIAPQSQHAMQSLESRRLLSTVVALTADTHLLKFDSARASAILSDQPVTGLQAGETLLGIDVRPGDGQLYGLGSTGRLYTIDPNTAVATLKSTLAADPADTTDPFTALNGTEFGIDFNPVADRLRVVSDAGDNLRVIPDTGLVTTDTPLAYDPGRPDGRRQAPVVVDAAYTNTPPGRPTTTLFAIDRSFYNMKTLTDSSMVPAMSFVTVGGRRREPVAQHRRARPRPPPSARDGVLPAGFDIAPDGTAYTGVKADFASGTRYLLVQVDPNSPVDSSHGNIGDGTTAVTDIAVIPSVQFSTVLIPATEGTAATVTVTRTDGDAGTFTVDYRTFGGTARAGADFTPASGTLTFAPGETSKTFTRRRHRRRRGRGRRVLRRHPLQPDRRRGARRPDRRRGADLGQRRPRRPAADRPVRPADRPEPRHHRCRRRTSARTWTRPPPRTRPTTRTWPRGRGTAAGTVDHVGRLRPGDAEHDADRRPVHADRLHDRRRSGSTTRPAA